MTRGQRDPWTIVLAAAVVVAGLVLHASLGPPDTYWTLDNGGKALALRALQQGRLHLDDPGAALDPERRHYALPLEGNERYAVVADDGRLLSQYQSPFVLLTVPFAALFGFAGLAILPALGAGAATFLTGAIARRRGGTVLAARLAAGTLAFATPLLFYASTFWEHTPTLALAAGAMLAFESRRPLTAGLLLGAAILLREELALLLAATMLVALLRRDGFGPLVRLALGAVPGVALLGIFQVLATGSLTGAHLEVNRAIPFAATLDAVEGLLLGTGPAGRYPTAVLLPLGLLAATRFRPGRGQGPLRGIGAAALAAVGAIAYRAFPSGGDSALALIHSNSAAIFVPWMLAAPVLAFAAGQRPGRSADAAIWIFIALFLILVPARSVTGIHPGPRMLLVAAPVLAATLATAVAARRRTILIAAPLLIVSVAWSVRSLDLLSAKRAHSGALAAAIRSRPEDVVATQLFWLPTEMASLWGEKTFFLVGTTDDVRDLAGRVAAGGRSGMLSAVLPGTIPGAPVLSVRDTRFPEFSVDLHALSLTNPPPPPGVRP